MQCPTKITHLSEGSENIFSDVWPSRRIQQVRRAELWSFEVPQPRACVLICPGGGYLELVADKEGSELAVWLNGHGYNAHVLIHRLPGAEANDGTAHPFDIALKDGLMALQFIGPDLPIFLAGLSSGGHLAGVLACQDALKPAGLLLGYAPINANHSAHKAPAHKPDYPPVEKQAFYDAWPIGLAEHPHAMPTCPAFLVYALHDTPVPIEHALNFIRSARDLGLDLDAHIYGAAPHGFALRELDGSHELWPALAKNWLSQQLNNVNLARNRKRAPSEHA